MDFFTQLDQLYQKGDLAETEAFLKREADRRTGANRAAVLNELGSFYRGTSRYPESEAAFQEALRLLEQAGQGKSSAYATVLMNLAGTYRLTRQLDRAEEQYLGVIAALDREEYAHVSALNNLSLVYQEQGKPDQAEKLLREALAWMEEHGSPPHEVATTWNNLANLSIQKEELAAAEQAIQKALELYEAMPEVNVHHAAAAATRAHLHYLRGDWGRALDAYCQALEMTEHFFGKNAEYDAILRSIDVVRAARERAQ